MKKLSLQQFLNIHFIDKDSKYEAGFLKDTVWLLCII